jgi:alkanesulfonate monooxygenase SsuD/methylene tetrahydromethanopterin reductase-like flavin-dependent oxidoreductase (luciferase family)
VRLFVADTPGGEPSELTHGSQRTVRICASDLAQAQRTRTRIRAAAGDVAVILDVTIAVAADFRSARRTLEPGEGVRYVGTVDGLAGLIADIETAGVADGVTLIPATPQQDLRSVGLDVLDWLAVRGHPRAS